MEYRVGTAGWTLPAALRDRFDGEGSHLERYARRFGAVEINSTFYRSHRPSTYARWATAVPADFRFALKVPREITHRRRLADALEPLAAFLDESAALGEKRDVLLVQLPPSLAFERVVAAAFFRGLRTRYAGRLACEPRHPSWFTAEADAVLAAGDVARVAADPAPAPTAGEPGGAASFRYWRLHGTPVVYRSAYDADRIAAIARSMQAADGPAWCVFDNTTFGAATDNALALLESLANAPSA